jgi:hypothetical protein
MFKLETPLYGDWSVPSFPDEVIIDGKLFNKAIRKQPYDGVIEQYREATPRESYHLLVLEDGHWIIDHVDDYNPDLGYPVRHFLIDHPVGKVLLFTGTGLIGMGIAAARGYNGKKAEE